MYSKATVNYLTLINSTIMFFMAGIAWILSFILLQYNFRYSKILSFSPTMLLYFLLVFVSSFQTCWHSLYQIIFWRPDKPIYNNVYIYIAVAVTGQFQATVPLVEFFVCLDRIFTVLYPGKYSGRMKYIPVIAAISITFALQFTYNYAYDFIGGIPWGNKTEIVQIYQKPGSMYYTNIKKATISICSLTATICFWFILRKIQFNSQQAKKLNKAIFSMLIVSVFVDFIPNVSYTIGMIVLGTSINTIIGSFSVTFTSINVGISSILYWNTFRKFYNQQETSKVTQISQKPARITSSSRHQKS